MPKIETVNKDTAIIVRNKEGSKIRRIKTQRRLSVEEGTLVKIINAKKAWGKKSATPAVLIPTANGYMQLAANCGIALNHPDTVIVDGVEQPNGFKDKTGTYYFRARSGGYTDLGQPFVIDRTVDYNVERYNVQDLLAKAKYDNNSAYFKVLPFRGKDEFGVLKGEPKDGDWAGYQVDNSTVLWVDCAAPDFVKWLSEMNNRSKNAIRTCQTFADRNAISAHPALPAKKKFETTEAVLDCVTWYAETGSVSMKTLLGESNVEIDATSSVSIDKDSEASKIIDVETESVPLEAGDIREEDDEVEEVEEKPPVAERPPKKDDKKAHAKILKKVDEMAEVKKISYQKARRAMGIDDAEALEMLSIKQLEELFGLLKMA